MNTVPFTKADIKNYIDICIRFWRKKRDSEEEKMAVYYIDAFQSVRSSLFGELLSTEIAKQQSNKHTEPPAKS